MFHPVVTAYSGVGGLDLEFRLMSGDHSFSWTRLELTGLIRDWMLKKRQ